MTHTHKIIAGLFSLLFIASLIGCSPEVGSDKWCANMKETPSGDWTANQAADFAKHCLLK